MSLSQIEVEAARTENPVDIIERLAALHDWTFDRDEEDEISIAVSGGWADYNIAFTWLQDMEALHVACAFDLKVPAARRTEVLSLVALINEQMWIGHFDIWPSDGVIMFRHALLLRGTPGASSESLEDLVDIAITECERFYPAFQFVLWGGKSPAEALECAMLECAGEA